VTLPPGTRLPTPSGVYFVGSVPLPTPGATCPSCSAPKRRPRPDAQGGGTWCSGCGARWDDRGDRVELGGETAPPGRSSAP